MNYFLTIWTKPNVTIREVIDKKSLVYGLFLLIVSSLGSSVLIFADGGGGLESFSLPVILLLSIGLTIVVSIPLYFISGVVYWLLGKMLSGTGDYKQVCLAMSAGALPMIGILPVSILAVVLYGKDLYAELSDPWAITNMSVGFYMFYTIVLITVSIYGVVILSKSLGYAHGFSALRGFGVVIVYSVFIFFLAIVFAFTLVFGGLMLFG